jgi:hypothetical protein
MAIVIDRTTLYMRLPSGLARLPSGKQWLKIDIAKATQAIGGSGLSSLTSSATTNPAQFLQYLRAESGQVTKVGSEVVRGVPTTHYRATVQLDRYPQLVPSAQRQQARQGIAALERASGIHSLPIDVWVDQQHLVRRERFGLDQTVAGQSVRILATSDIYDYGPQPTVTPPPSAQVYDATAAVSSAVRQRAGG